MSGLLLDLIVYTDSLNNRYKAQLGNSTERARSRLYTATKNVLGSSPRLGSLWQVAPTGPCISRGASRLWLKVVFAYCRGVFLLASLRYYLHDDVIAGTPRVLRPTGRHIKFLLIDRKNPVLRQPGDARACDPGDTRPQTRNRAGCQACRRVFKAILCYSSCCACGHCALGFM